MGEGSKGFSCQLLLLREETQWVKVPRDFLVNCCCKVKNKERGRGGPQRSRREEGGRRGGGGGQRSRKGEGSK